jgi:hypothetical protein
VQLACEHYISVMAYHGLVVVPSHESTEAIKCPVCRCPLQLKIVREAVTTFEFDQKSRTKDEILNFLLHVHKHKYISQDALLYGRGE